ncbi:hypothetical protein Tco_0573953 [Tanacetum coccineum]
MILHSSEEKKVEVEAEIVNVADSTDSGDLDTQPLSKKFKISPSISNIIKPTPLSSILPEHPIRDPSKGNEIVKDDSMLEITSLLEEGGSTQKTIDLKEFSLQGKKLTIEEATEQMKEIQRLANLKKAEEEVENAKKVGVPPPPELATFDGMNWNLTPPTGIIPIDGLVIAEPKSGIFFMNKNTDVAFQRESEFHLTLTVQLIRIQNQIKIDSEVANEMV